MKVVAVLLIFLTFSGLALAAQQKAICAVCGPREGAGFEPVKATATHKGKHYYFCSLECKVEFLKNPDAFLITDAGKPAPPFSLKTIDGKKVTLSELRGKVVLADFWATYCIPCVKALPELEALQKKYGPDGFTVIGLSVDDRAALVTKASSRAKVTYPIAIATAEVWNAYKVNALPSLVLIGRDGKIVRRFGGEADRKLMLAAIEEALAAR